MKIQVPLSWVKRRVGRGVKRSRCGAPHQRLEPWLHVGRNAGHPQGTLRNLVDGKRRPWSRPCPV